jgi:hypothetical protein
MVELTFDAALAGLAPEDFVADSGRPARPPPMSLSATISITARRRGKPER